jgi:hypothetical protein
MIIARVEGGLGNQLFIYAAARALALRTGHQLQFDIWNGGYQDGNHYGRRYQLDEFNIVGSAADRTAMAPYRSGSRKYYWRRKLNRHLPFGLRNLIEERKIFEPNLLTFKPRGNVYLAGYWQREDYFRKYRAALLQELTLKQAPSSASLEIARRMTNCESAFLHVRRIDYAHCLSSQYYADALRILVERVKQPSLFVFGDDLAWAKREIPLPAGTQFVSHNDDTQNIEDLWLMTQCRHAIVANSSFSWWGAWLNDTTGRTVIGPGAWGYRAAAAPGWLTVDPQLCGVARAE